MDLATYANIAEIFGAVTIVGGAIYAAVQFTESRGRRRDQVSVELFRAFSDSELGRAIALLKRSTPMDARVPRCTTKVRSTRRPR